MRLFTRSIYDPELRAMMTRNGQNLTPPLFEGGGGDELYDLRK